MAYALQSLFGVGRVERLIAGVALAMSVLACSYDYAGASRCDNGVKDGDELDVDCGGSCVADLDAGNEGRCGYGMWCNVDSDCDSDFARCELGRCTPKKLTAKWVRVTSPSHMVPRFGARLTFQGKTQGVLTGGLSRTKEEGFESLQDAWVFAAGRWRRANMEPSRRFYHAQAYDEVLKELLLAGGEDLRAGTLSDTWARKLGRDEWRKLSKLPAPRSGAAMVHVNDENDPRMVFYGAGDKNEIWVRKSTPDAKWLPATTKGAPPMPYWHAMAYDQERKRIVVFGGRAGSGTGIQTTSRLDPSKLQWQTEEFVDGPRARWGAAMAFDSDRKRVVLFGGRYGGDDTSDALQDTWEWNGNAWSQVKPVDSEQPTKCFHAALDYDPVARKMVLVSGGKSGFWPVDPGETWTYAVLGWPCGGNADCGEGTYCVDRLCCNSACDSGVCNHRDQPGVCTKP
jgi:hypothetical protein